MYHSFEDLAVWKRACRLAVRVYEVLGDCTDYDLKTQMTRSAVSIGSNTAEGAERDSKQEFRRFLNIAKGSAAELRTQVYIVCCIDEITDDVATELAEECREISAMLQGLINSLDKEWLLSLVVVAVAFAFAVILKLKT